MWRTSMLPVCLLLVWASPASSQSDAACPANTAMGLCTEVAKPCYGDSDCLSGEICCPEACTRSCKPRYATSVVEESAIPDLLNDPRVYVGKCPDASCYSIFGGEPNECSTTNLCAKGQVCCNDGCKNVCQWKPEYVARIAQEQARARQHQQLLIQRQQQEMRRRQQEMFAQQQRQRAAAEQNRKQVEARAAAEAELAAQQARVKFEANLKAAAAQARILSSSQPQKKTALRQSSDFTGSFLDKFVGEPQTISVVQEQAAPQQQQKQPLDLSGNTGYTNANKKDNQHGSSLNHINSPANRNPYTLLSQQNVQSKAAPEELLSLIQSAPATSITQNLANNTPVKPSSFSTAQNPLPAYLVRQTPPSNPISPQPNTSILSSSRNGQSFYQSQKAHVSYPILNQSPPVYTRQLSPAERLPNMYPRQQVPSTFQTRTQPNTYPTQNALSMNPTQNYYNQHSLGFPYRFVRPTASPASYREQQPQDTLTPFLLYQAMTAL